MTTLDICLNSEQQKIPQNQAIDGIYITYEILKNAGSGTLHLSIQHSKTLDFIRAFGILKFLKLVQGADRGQTIKLIFWQSADYLFPVTF